MPESILKELNFLEAAITGLRIEYERFFAGDLRLPPHASRRKVDELVKKMGSVEVERVAERFRFQSLQARYSTLVALWEKKLIAREEGRGLKPHAEAVAAPAAPPPPASDAAGASSVEKKRRVDLTPLFDRYCAARQALGEDVSKLRYERFEDLVKKQAEEIKRRTGSGRLVFEVQTVDGKVRLVGRPAAPKG